MTCSSSLMQTRHRQTISTVESLPEVTFLPTEEPRFLGNPAVSPSLHALQRKPSMSNWHSQPRKLSLQAGLLMNWILSVPRLRCFLSPFMRTINQRLTLSIDSTALTAVRSTLVPSITTYVNLMAQSSTFATLPLPNRRPMVSPSRLIVSNTKASFNS